MAKTPKVKSPEAFECCANLRSVSMNEPMDRKMLTSACLYAALNEQEMTELISTEVYPMSRTILKFRGHRIPQIC